MASAVEAALDRLENARQGWWICSSVCNLLLMIVLSFATLGLFILADVLFQLPQLTLGLLLFLWLVLSLAMVAWAAFRLSREQRTLEGAARQVELAFPQVGSDLINLIQLTNSNQVDRNGFQAAAIEEAAVRLIDVPFYAAAHRQPRWSRWRLGLQTPRDLAEVIVACCLIMLVAVAVHWAIPTWRSSADRLLAPWRYMPQTGSVQILEVTPGDGEVLVGSRLVITAKIADPNGLRPSAVLDTMAAGEEKMSRGMLPNESHDTFTFALPSVASAFEYQLQIGDSQSNLYRIGIRETPTIRDVEVTYQFPEYLGLPEQTIQQKHADLDAPQYSLAIVKFLSSAELSRGYVQLPDRQIAGRVGEDAKTLNVRIPMNEPTTFTVHLFNELGHTDSQPRVNNLRVSEDAPPTVQIAKPSREMTIAPDSELSVVVRAADDHGLTSVRLEWKPADQADDTAAEMPIERLHQWDISGSAATLRHKLRLDSGRFQVGQAILLRAVAVDGREFSVKQTRLSPQQTASSWVRISLISPEQQASETLSRLEQIRSQLLKILQTQILARIATAEIPQQTRLEDALRLAIDVSGNQVRVQTTTSELAKTMDGTWGADTADWKQTLGRLAAGEMLLAAQQAELIETSKSLATLAGQAGVLMQTQDEVIKILQKSLKQARRESSEAELASDREARSQDEPPTGETKETPRDEMKETPMAGLPGELEVLLGDLMEEEENLFAELEGISGSADDRLDKDADKDDGGKGGPTEQETQRALDRMANRQADLRNRAASVDVKFQVLNYHHTDLRRMVEVMKSVESDLRSGRYQSALRRRETVLQGLGSIKTYLGGEFEVRRDQTSNLPADVQEKLFGSMLEASPAGWEDLNRKYFERLSGEQRTADHAADKQARPKSADDK